MKMYFIELLEREIQNLFLIIWPPLGERDSKNIDISLGLVLEGGKEMFVVTTNKDDNWTPLIVKENIPSKYFSADFYYDRISRWENCEIDAIIDREYYDFTNSELFNDIVGQKILDIEWITVKGLSPFGIKLNFEKDYIISTPISDGNTIETKRFNVINNVDYYRLFGEIEYLRIC